MTIRARVLAALERGPLVVVDVAKATRCKPQSVRNCITSLIAYGWLVGAQERRGSNTRLWSITDSGRIALGLMRQPAVHAAAAGKRVSAPAVVRQAVLTTRVARSQLLAQYSLDHEQHILRQRKLGIPEALIGAELLGAMPTTRGVA